jgi:hypothetical protein
MNCLKEMTREEIVKKFTKKFVATKYKEHREHCLFDLEKAMLPATQPIVERMIQNEKLREEIIQIRSQIARLYNQIQDYEFQIRGGEKETVERKTFIRKCPNADCRGFLSTQWKCNLCERKTCKECNESMLDLDDHKCDPNNVETAKLLAKDSKPCPKCGEMIFKIDGCFAKDTPILLWDGSTKISQEICVGDLLTGDDGTPRCVLDLCSGEDDLYQIEQKNGLSYTVNSKHTLLLKLQDSEAIMEILVDEYMKLPIEQTRKYLGFKKNLETTPIHITYVGKGHYYGWKVDKNHRFLLNDFTVVRNCAQIWCTQCRTAFNWNTGKIETGVVHNPHYFEWLKSMGKDVSDNPERDMHVRCGREIDHFFVRDLSRNLPRKNTTDVAVSLCRNLIHFRAVELPRYQTDQFNDNQDLRVLYLRNRITEETFRTTLQKREKARQKREDYYRLFAMMIQCVTEIMFRYYDQVLKARDEPIVHIEFKFIQSPSQNVSFEPYLDEIINLLTYVNECLHNISVTYNCQKYILHTDLTLESVRH